MRHLQQHRNIHTRIYESQSVYTYCASADTLQIKNRGDRSVMTAIMQFTERIVQAFEKDEIL